MASLYVLQFDGGSVPNPGQSAAGAVLYSPEGKTLFEVGDFLGWGTNNRAEYRGLIIGLQRARDRKIKRLHVRGDSQLVIKQVKGEWKVKKEELKPLYREVIELSRDFEQISFEHVYRENNAKADALANEALAKEAAFFRSFSDQPTEPVTEPTAKTPVAPPALALAGSIEQVFPRWVLWRTRTQNLARYLGIDLTLKEKYAPSAQTYRRDKLIVVLTHFHMTETLRGEKEDHQWFLNELEKQRVIKREQREKVDEIFFRPVGTTPSLDRLSFDIRIEGERVRITGPLGFFFYLSFKRYFILKEVSTEDDIVATTLRYDPVFPHYGTFWSMPRPAREYIHRHPGIIECFASPFDRTATRFCSLFPDTDRRYGSLGRFFDTWESFQPGFFAVNPPFAPDVIEEMWVALKTLLQREDGFYTMYSYLPYWKDLPSIDEMTRTPWTRAVVELFKGDHDSYSFLEDKIIPGKNFDLVLVVLSNDPDFREDPIQLKRLFKVL